MRGFKFIGALILASIISLISYEMIQGINKKPMYSIIDEGEIREINLG